MKVEASKKAILIFALSITTALLTGGVIGEQFLYLHVFYSKYVVHWGVGVLIFVVFFLISFKASSGNSGYLKNINLGILFLLISILGFHVVLKSHEYTHLSYLLSYVMLGVLGRFMAMYLQRFESKLLSFIANSVIIICVLIGAVWRFLNWQNELYFYFIIFTIAIYAFSLYKSKMVFKAVSIIFLVPICFLIKRNIEPAELSRYQSKYTDRVIFSKRTSSHQIDVTSWRGKHWFYYDMKVQFSTVDEALYSETMVHPIMLLLEHKKKILVIGGENGIVIKELLKYNSINKIDILILDSKLYELAKSNPLFTKANQHSLKSNKITPTTFTLIKNKSDYYDAIFIDSPDPSNNKWNAYYTNEFYEICYAVLSEKGMMITQAGNPYLSSKAFASIEKTLQSVNFSTLPIHNQILTLGEWGWIIASKNTSHKIIKTQLINSIEGDFDANTWINQEALQMIVSFGKKRTNLDDVEINRVNFPTLFNYHKKGDYRFE